MTFPVGFSMARILIRDVIGFVLCRCTDYNERATPNLKIAFKNRKFLASSAA